MPDQIQENNQNSMTAPKVNPETQALFDMFLINGMELIYDEKQAQSMLPRIGSSQDPTKAIAELLVDIIFRVVSSAKDAGKIIPPEVILHGGNILFAELLKVFEAAGMESLTEEQKTAVWQMATSIYLDKAVQAGQITKEELMMYKQQIEQTDQGKKIIQTAENPGAGVKQAMPANQDQAQPMAVTSNGIAAPQGGM